MKVATINFYAGNPQPVADCHLIESLGFDVVGMQEAHRRLELIKHELNDAYHIFHHVKANPTRGSREVAVLIHKHRDYRIHGHGSYKVAPAAIPIKIAPERYLVWVRFTDAQGRKRCIINTHTQAAVQSHRTGALLPRNIKRIAGYVSGMRAVSKEARRARRDGYPPIITGDLNYRRYPRIATFTLAYWSPQRVFRRLHMAWREHILDYIAWTPGNGMRYKNEGTISQARTGADHDWLWVDLD